MTPRCVVHIVSPPYICDPHLARRRAWSLGEAAIPTRKACAEGSYEVTNSMLQPGSGEMLVEAAIQLLRK